ncbi:MAG: hypothetical protein AAB727_01525 [Patescibacteria group bacterium]
MDFGQRINDGITGKFSARFKKPVLLLTGLVVVIAISLLVVFITKPSLEDFPKIPFVNLPAQEDPFENLKGKIYMTLAPKDDNATNLYVLNVDSKRIEPLFDFYGEEDFGDLFVGVTSKFSPLGDEFAYMAAPIDRDPKKISPIGTFLGLFVFNTETRTWQGVSKSSLHNKRLPQWSPKGTEIVFNGREQGIGSFSADNLEGWGIYVTDLNGNERRVTSGAYPHWSPAGDALIFLRDDGLYVYNFLSKRNIKVYSLSEEHVKINTKLGVSGDGSLLALSNPNTADVSVFKIISWNPFQMQLIKRLSERTPDGSVTDFYWPVFSPDNRYLALQATERDVASRAFPKNPRIVVYELSDFKQKVIGSLGGFNFDLAFTTDWRY